MYGRYLDIAAEADAVEPADVVVLHRVVCCYPDARGLLAAAAQHSRRLLVFSYQPDNAVTRTGFWSENLIRRFTGSTFPDLPASPRSPAGSRRGQ